MLHLSAFDTGYPLQYGRYDTASRISFGISTHREPLVSDTAYLVSVGTIYYHVPYRISIGNTLRQEPLRSDNAYPISVVYRLSIRGKPPDTSDIIRRIGFPSVKEMGASLPSDTTYLVWSMLHLPSIRSTPSGTTDMIRSIAFPSLILHMGNRLRSDTANCIPLLFPLLSIRGPPFNATDTTRSIAIPSEMDVGNLSTSDTAYRICVGKTLGRPPAI